MKDVVTSHIIFQVLLTNAFSDLSKIIACIVRILYCYLSYDMSDMSGYHLAYEISGTVSKYVVIYNIPGVVRKYIVTCQIVNF